MKITFLGTGTSQGVPVISCGCWVCQSEDSRDKRLRSSLMIEYKGMRLLIDAGPDFRQQMLRENVRSLDGILLTHAHKDHINGLDDVRAFNYTSGKPVNIYAEERVLGIIRKDFDYAFGEKRYPGVPDMNLIPIDENPFSIRQIKVIPIRGKHLDLPVLGFRIGRLAYITDMNYIPESEMEKMRDLDTLIINALRREQHISHFTLDEALHIGYLLSPRATYLTHISHQMGRYAQVEHELPEGSHLSYDGLKIEIGE